MDLFEEFLDGLNAPSEEQKLESYSEVLSVFRKMAEAPDVLGLAEGQFAAPMDQVLQGIAAVISHEFKMHQEYTFYAEMLRGTERSGLADVFSRHAYDENRDAQYFLKRLSALQPGGIPIPMVPSPEPLADAASILTKMIAGEQQAIMMLRQLHQLVGENPMKFQIEQMLADEQKHLDTLWQFQEVQAPKATPKMAAAVLLMRKRANDVIMQEQAMGLAQSQNEKAFLVNQLEQTRQELVGQQEAAAQAQQTAQQSQEQAQQAVAQAEQAQQDALAGQTAAADHANGKLRLAQRIQQMRQALADLAAQDPVAEEGVGVDPTMTSTQQQQAADQQAMEQQQPQNAEQAKQMEEAGRAQQDAQIQAQQAQGKTAALSKTAVSRKWLQDRLAGAAMDSPAFNPVMLSDAGAAYTYVGPGSALSHIKGLRQMGALPPKGAGPRPVRVSPAAAAESVPSPAQAQVEAAEAMIPPAIPSTVSEPAAELAAEPGASNLARNLGIGAAVAVPTAVGGGIYLHKRRKARQAELAAPSAEIEAPIKAAALKMAMLNGLRPGDPGFAEAVGAALRLRTKQRGAAQMADALGISKWKNPMAPKAHPVLPPPPIPGLGKTSGVEDLKVHDRLEHLSRRLRPGDIVVMTPKPADPDANILERAGNNVFSAISDKVQGKYTHSGIYVGKGHVVDIRAETGVRKIPLKELTKQVGVAALRPKVDAEARRRAVEKAHEYLARKDEIKYDITKLPLAGLSGPIKFKDRPIDEQNVICSSMVANMYDKHNLTGVARHVTKPSDFVNSKSLKPVGAYDLKKVALSIANMSPAARVAVTTLPGAVIGGGIGYAAAPENHKTLGTVGGALLGGAAGTALGEKAYIAASSAREAAQDRASEMIRRRAAAAAAEAEIYPPVITPKTDSRAARRVVSARGVADDLGLINDKNIDIEL